MSLLLSIVTPTFNEVENIEKLSLKIREVCNLKNINYEQIIIDNDSNDGTIKVIKELTSKYKNIKAIKAEPAASLLANAKIIINKKSGI